MIMTLKKAWSDLRSNPGRTGLVVAALVIGLWGVGSLLVSYTILRNDLNENFMRTKPAHAVLTSRDFGALDIAVFRNKAEVESAEFRDLSIQRVEARPNEWIPLLLFGVEDFGNFQLARFYRERGNAAPDSGTMLIERNVQLVSTLDVGSRAHLRIGPRPLDVRVTGVVFDPAQAPATQDHIAYGYLDQETYARLTGAPLHQRLMVRLRDVQSREDVRRAVDTILADLRSRGIAVQTVNIPTLNEHPHQWQLNTLLFLEGSIAFLAFLMGAVLVSQLMSAILAGQIRQIGILKAIGASQSDVLRIYLAMVLMFGVAAAVIAIPLALSSGYAFAGFVSRVLNFEILTTRVPPHLYASLAAAGLLLPLVLSLPAIMKGVRVSAYEALNDYGIWQDFRRGRVAGGVARVLPAGLVMAFRNIMRQKRRLLITIVTMGLGVAIFSTGFNVRQSLWVLLSDVRDGMKHDVQVVLNNQIPRDEALLPFRSIGNVERIETWSGGRGDLQSRVVATVEGIGVVALPWDTDLMKPKLVHGRWLLPSGEPEVVMNQKAMEIYGKPPIGSRQTLGVVGGTPVTVKLVGEIEELELPKIYIDKERFDVLVNPDHRVNSLMFVAKEKSYGRVVALKEEIERAVAQSDLSVLYVMSQAERVKVIYDHLDIILSTILLLALVVLIVSALGMASATGITIMERTREIGVLRAIGATPAMIYRLFVTEGMITSVASMVLGMFLSWPLSVVASAFFGNLMLGNDIALHYEFSQTGFLVTLCTTVVFGWLASRVPARSAIRVSTREALAYA